MKFLIIGLGSMGKRRVRNLKYLKAGKILGFDLREDRRKEAKEKYGIETVGSFKDLDLSAIDAFIISTPPDRHNECIKLAIENKKPAFVEASVILKGLEELNKRAKKEKVLIAPSFTLSFHPAIKEIKRIVKSKKYGRVTNFSYHSGLYLPDWHPWEKVKDFYAGKKETGGAREIIPFELAWITDIFGFPEKTKGFFGKTMNVGADIDDTYAVLLDFGGVFGNLIIDVVSRYATRNLILNMERGQILWGWEDNFLKIYDASRKKWENYYFKKGRAAKGYIRGIMGDIIYIDEMKSFIDSAKGKAEFPNSLDEDIKVLKLLNKIEEK